MIYLNKSFLNCDFREQGWFRIDREIRARAEILLERAESHLDANKSKDSRTDCLLTLKMALNQRLKAIEEIYEFKNLDIPDKRKGYIELLEKIGIVRPLFLKKLLKIRNSIEHEDVDPPSYNQCKEYVDVVWYFIKSTQRHVSIKLTNQLFQKLNRNGVDTQYWVEVDTENNDYKRVEIRGWVPKSYLRKNTAKQNYFLFDAKEICTWEEKGLDKEGHENKISSDTFVSGYLDLVETQRLEIVRRIMSY